jgi:hypothetical protein
MDLPAGKIILNGAPSQYDRHLPALLPDYAPVDGRSFAELLSFSIKFGALVNFFGPDDEVDGDWVGFFASDPTMVLAVLATADLNALECEFMRLERLTLRVQVPERKFELLSAIFNFIQGIARRINDALKALDPAPGDIGGQLSQLLVNLITTSLRPELQRLKDYAEGAALPQALGRPIPMDWQGFLAIWNLQDGCPDGSIYRGRSFNRKIEHAVPHLASIFAIFRDALADLVAFARANLEASLADPDHKPQIGLFIAFARLFQTAQATINQTSDRYRRFYYDEVLRGRPAGPVADQVYLTFVLAADAGISSTTVPAGTRFPAGQDADGTDILYASERPLTVTAAQIARTCALRVVRGPLILDDVASPPQTEASETLVHRVLGSQIALADAAAQSVAWPVFGSDEVGATEVTVTTPATLGFAVASPYLLLTGGERHVQLIVGYSEAFHDRLIPLLDELAAAVGEAPAAIFRQILEAAFSIEASTATGWFKVTPYTAVVPTSLDPAFTLCFTLPATAPPIVAIDPTAEGDATATSGSPPADVPTLRLYLRQAPTVLTSAVGEAGSVRVYPLSLLDGMALQTLEIATGVTALPGTQLQNTDGPIDETSPFPLFGAPAVPGSYLEIRHQELFAKRIESLRLTVSWFNWPPNQDGFAGYYRDYVIGLDGKPQPGLFDNAVFRVAIGLQDPGIWCFAADSPSPESDLCLFRTLPLCQTTEPIAPLCPETVFVFDGYDISDHAAPPYYSPSNSALTVRLTAPAYGFGDDLYAINVLNAVVSDLPSPDGCNQKCEAECAVLKDSAAAVAFCMEQCSGEDDDKFKACITGCLAGCVAQMLLSVVECLANCLRESRTALGAATYQRVSASFETASTAAPAAPSGEQAARLRDWINAMRSQPGLNQNCLNKCLSLIEAILSIGLCQITCDAVPSDGYRACVLSGLQGCVSQLETAYALCFEQCVDACMKLKDPMKYPNAPWLPTAQSVTVDYTAHCVVLGAPAAASGAEAGRFFHLLPFGGYTENKSPTSLLPIVADQGQLRLGFSGLARGLTLLFEMGGSSEDSGSPPVAWELLCADRWIRLEGAQVAADGSNGLRSSGILVLSLPDCGAAVSTIMPGESRWLRATVGNGVAHFPPAVGIYPNAALARWQDVAGTGASLDRPLPPHTITTSVEPLPAIESIDQPIESFGGRPAESTQQFEIRLGERLRHKHRAILSWDYERLVLEQFPIIWKAQALPARTPSGRVAAPHVLVVVVPGPDSTEVQDPTVPSASPVLLDAIRTRLQRAASPFVRLSVANPVYVRIEVEAVVALADTEDAGAAITRLNDELVRYLSPWFYDAARATLEGRYVDEDAISTFIETRPYVDELWELRLWYDPAPDAFEWFFLTSARQHRISTLPVARPPPAQAERDLTSD